MRAGLLITPFGVALLPGRVLAAPKVAATIVWQGDCDERSELAREALARGAELEELAAAPLRLSVEVDRVVPDFFARVELRAQDAHEVREVTARACAELRSAVAWVLVTFAEERRAAEPSVEAPAAVEPLPSSAPVAAQVGPRPASASQPTPAPIARARPSGVCATGDQRWPSGPAMLTSAPSAIRQAAQSAAGSASATLPPIVPRFRMAR